MPSTGTNFSFLVEASESLAASLPLEPMAKESAKSTLTEKRKQRREHISRLLETSVIDFEAVVIEDGILKSAVGIDIDNFHVEHLRELGKKLGIQGLRKCPKESCINRIVSAYQNATMYDAADEQLPDFQRPSKSDSLDYRCRLLNVLFSDNFVQRLESLGDRKSRAELDSGGAGRDEAFWRDVATDFGDVTNNSYGLLNVQDLEGRKAFEGQKVDPARNIRPLAWDDHRRMYDLITKDYKKKHERYKTSGNHNPNFLDYTRTRLDTYYLHLWLVQRGTRLRTGIVSEVPPEVFYDSKVTGGLVPSTSFGSTVTDESLASSLASSMR